MITTPAEYLAKLEEIKKQQDQQLSGRLAVPSTEPRFIINANTREITVPSALQTVGVTKDHNAETVFFEIDRYFDDVDLFNKTIAIQYINAAGKQYVIGPTSKNLEEGTGKIVFGWTLSEDALAQSGKIRFSVRIYSIDEDTKVMNYNLGTKTASVTVAEGLYIVDKPETLPTGSALEDLIDKIYKIWNSETGIINSQGNYEKLTNKPSINGVELRGALTSNDLKIEAVIPDDVLRKKDVDEELDRTLTSTNPIANKTVAEAIFQSQSTAAALDKKISELEEQMGNMTFVPLSFNSLTINDLTECVLEKGQILESPIVKWSLTKTPDKLTVYTQEITGESLKAEGECTLGTFEYNTMTKQEVVSISAEAKSDFKNETVTKNAYIRFVDGIYYKALTEEDTAESLTDNEFDRTITKITAGTPISITIDGGEAEEKKYIYVLLPQRTIGTPKFSVGGFVGGFEKLDDIEDFTNESGYTGTSYYVYKSTNAGLGKINISITYS